MVGVMKAHGGTMSLPDVVDVLQCVLSSYMGAHCTAHARIVLEIQMRNV